LTDATSGLSCVGRGSLLATASETFRADVGIVGEKIE
jgi:hypothetical protein